MSMTPEHIDGARKLAEVIYLKAFNCDPSSKTEMANGTPYGCWAQAMNAAEAIVPFLAAAEERGRSEERERNSVAAAKLDIALNAMWSTINTGCVWKLEDAIEEMNVIDMSIPRDAITKEPTL